MEETAKRAGDKAATKAEATGGDVEAARKKAILPFIAQDGTRLRFHDLRHQAITELTEGGASDATLMALAGHMSREMLEHYSHVRMAAKRAALDKLANADSRPGEGNGETNPEDASKAVTSQSTSQKPIS